MLYRRPHRLPHACYRGAGRYFLTFCTFDRQRHFVCEAGVDLAESCLWETAWAAGFELEAYCFMPDHLHVLLSTEDGDLIRFATSFKQRSGFGHRRMRADPLWQKGYHDRILRRGEDARTVAEYILMNPVRRGLCREWQDHPHSWSRWHPRS